MMIALIRSLDSGDGEEFGFKVQSQSGTNSDCCWAGLGLGSGRGD